MEILSLILIVNLKTLKRVIIFFKMSIEEKKVYKKLVKLIKNKKVRNYFSIYFLIFSFNLGNIRG